MEFLNFYLPVVPKHGMNDVAPSLTPRKEVTHGSCKEAGLEEDHQERGQEARGQEGQVSLPATVCRLTKKPRFYTGAIFLDLRSEKSDEPRSDCVECQG